MKICILLTKTQTEILLLSINGIVQEDLAGFGRWFTPMITQHLEKVRIKLENKITNWKAKPGKRFRMSINKADACAVMLAFSQVEFNKSTESAMLRTVLNEIDRNL